MVRQSSNAATLFKLIKITFKGIIGRMLIFIIGQNNKSEEVSIQLAIMRYRGMMI